ncbi:hypothetical protein ACSTJ7_09555 [Vibrio parahaemolyticus]|uniref:hypothetical protein n=1 Tax=Vibrio parahaemolyticus TaxID=670 RepID=UPI00111E9FB6|nr:hypothetical protein [Vibrio parahaemolyticus]HCE1991839.1 hypothetical protein [Vibrio parahaemolyticus]HCG8138075.1 hypothetical protein [Vibrio parahaemolyticus]HCG8143382.1 hypothetical protein [Vibrio parahaemolyticus]HCG9605484.1 hypothetical protein [Vibrio parahaemolyticus]
MSYKTPMLTTPQQTLVSNDKHFTVFAVIRENQDALNFKTPNRRTFLGQTVSENLTWPFELKNGEPLDSKFSHKTKLSHENVRATQTRK